MPSRRVRHLMFSSKALGASASYFAPAITGLSNGDAVGTWSDISGNGNDATASSSQRPTYVLSGQGGLPTISFNGTSNYFTLTTTIATGNPFEQILVGAPDSNTANFNGLINSSSFVPYPLTTDGSGQFVVYHGGDGAYQTSTAQIGWSVLDSEYHGSGRTLWQNMKSLSLSFIAGPVPNSVYNVIGNRGGTDFCHGSISALLAFKIGIGATMRFRINQSFGYTFRIAQSGS